MMKGRVPCVGVPCSLLLLLMLASTFAQPSELNGGVLKQEITVRNREQLQSAASAIQEAWLSAEGSCSARLILAPGTYDVLQTITFHTAPAGGGRLVLEGAGMKESIIDCGGSLLAGVNITASVHVYVKGIQFTGCAPGLTVTVGGRSGTGEPLEVVIDSAAFVANLVSGMKVENVPSVIVMDSLYERNTHPDSVNCVGGAHILLSEKAEVLRTRFFRNNCTGWGSGVAGLKISNTTSQSVLFSEFESNEVQGAVANGGLWLHFCDFCLIKNSTFRKNSANAVGSAGAALVEGTDTDSYIEVTGSLFERNTALQDYSRGGLFIHGFINLTIAHSEFIENHASGSNSYSGLSIIACYPGATGSVSHTRMIGNTAVGYSGIAAGVVAGAVTFWISDVYVAGNAAMFDSGRGGLVLYNIGSVVVVRGYFEGNRGSCDAENERSVHLGAHFSGFPTVDHFMCGGGGLFVYRCESVVASSIFRNNSGDTMWFAGGAVLAHSAASLHILNCTFNGNTAAVGGAVAAVANSFILIDSPIFEERVIGHGCNADPFFSNLYGTWPQLWDMFTPGSAWSSTFSSNDAIAGGAVATLDSVLSIAFMPQIKCTVHRPKLVVFKNNRALSGGAIVSLRPAGGFFIMHAEFENNTAHQYDELSGSMLHGRELSDSFAVSRGCGIGNGGAICLSTSGTYQGSNQAIAASRFSKNSAAYGGALYITADSSDCPEPDGCNTIAITGLQQCNPTFQALYMPDPSNAMLPHSQVNISDNTASGGAGGAVYLEHTNLMHTECGYSDEIPEQTASFCVEDSPFEKEAKFCDHWVNNKAVDGAFGPNIATSPVDYTLELVHPEQMVSYSSGDEIPMQLKIYDQFNQEHVTVMRNTAQASQVLFNIRAEQGDVVRGQMVTEADAGRMSVNKSTFSFQATPGPVTVTVTASLSRLKRELPRKEINVTVRGCKVGEFSANRGLLCLRCDVGRFNLENSSHECRICPNGALCTQNTTEDAINPIILPLPQNFHSNPFSQQIIQCPNPQACDYKGRTERILLYQNQITEMDPWAEEAKMNFNISAYYELLCSEGYTGPGCALCRDGYGLSGVTKCIECKSSKHLERSILFLIHCIALIPLLWSMRVAMQNLNKWEHLGQCRVYISRKRQVLVAEAASMKTIVSYLQIIGMLKWIHISSSAETHLTGTRNVLADALKIADSVVYVANNLGSMSCSHARQEDVDASIVSVIISFAVPVCGFLLLVVIFGLPDFWTWVKIKICSIWYSKESLEQAAAQKKGLGNSCFAIRKQSKGSFLNAATQEKEKGGKCSDKSDMKAVEYTSGKGTEEMGSKGVAESDVKDAEHKYEKGAPVSATSTASTYDYGARSSSEAPTLKNPTGDPTDCPKTSSVTDCVSAMSSCGGDLMSAYSSMGLKDQKEAVKLGKSVFSGYLHQSPPASRRQSTPSPTPPAAAELTGKSYMPADHHSSIDDDVAIELGLPPLRVYKQAQVAVFMKVDLNDPDVMAEMGIDSYDPSSIRTKGRKTTNEKYPNKPSLFDVRKFSSACIVAFIITTFYYYSNLLQQTILIFMCSSIDSTTDTELAVWYGLNTGQRWTMNYDMYCYEGQHLFLVYFLGIPGIIFSIGLPFFWAWWLIKNKDKHEHADFKARYSFMYEDYKSECYVWGSVDMLHKLALMAVLVLLSNHSMPPGLQVISALTIATAFCIGHLLVRPHFNVLLQRMNFAAELAIVVTLMYCVYFTYEYTPTGYEIIALLLGLINIICIATLILTWCKLMVDNMVMGVGLEPREIHMMQAETIVQVMWPKNCFSKWFVKTLEIVIAMPLLVVYKVAHFIALLFQKAVTGLCLSVRCICLGERGVHV